MDTPIVIILAAGLLFFLLALYYMRRRFSIYFFIGTLVAVIAAGILHLQPAFIYGSTETASQETAPSPDDEEAPPTKEEEETEESDTAESDEPQEDSSEEEASEEEEKPEEEPVEEAPSDANTDAEEDGNGSSEAEDENLDNPGAAKADSYGSVTYYKEAITTHHDELKDNIASVQSVLSTYDQNYPGESNQALYEELETLRAHIDEYYYIHPVPDEMMAFDEYYLEGNRLIYDGLGYVDYAIWEYEDYDNTAELESVDRYMNDAYAAFENADQAESNILEGGFTWEGISYEY